MDDGVLYVALLTGLPAQSETTVSSKSSALAAEPKASAKPSGRPVADDTSTTKTRRKSVADEGPEEDEEVQKPATRGKRGSKKASSDEPVEIEPKDWKKLAAGTTVLAKILDDEGEVMLDATNNNCEYFTVDVVKYDKKTGELTIEYHCDGEQTILQDGDQLFEYNLDVVS